MEASKNFPCWKRGKESSKSSKDLISAMMLRLLTLLRRLSWSLSWMIWWAPLNLLRGIYILPFCWIITKRKLKFFFGSFALVLLILDHLQCRVPSMSISPHAVLCVRTMLKPLLIFLCTVPLLPVSDILLWMLLAVLHLLYWYFLRLCISFGGSPIYGHKEDGLVGYFSSYLQDVMGQV